MPPMSFTHRARVVIGRLSGWRGVAVSAVAALGLMSCGDPVTDDAIAALGPEAADVPPGPLHRPGQPCLLCHRDGGQAPAFTLAGTVVANVTSEVPVAGVSILVVDAANTRFTMLSNCAGNFFVTSQEYAPHYPVWFSVRDGAIQRDMQSPAYREGSCGACHTRPVSPSSPGPVYVIQDPALETLPPSPCP